MDGPNPNIRGLALQKVAVLTASAPQSSSNDLDFSRLHRIAKAGNNLPGKVYLESSSGQSLLPRTPTTVQELYAIIALCKAGIVLNDFEKSKQLLSLIGPCLEDAQTQDYVPSPFLRLIEPSPWEALAFNLVATAICIGAKHESLHADVYGATIGYLRKCSKCVQDRENRGGDWHGDVNVQQTLGVATLAVSVLGFIDAVSLHIAFYSSSEQLEIICFLREILSESFLVSVEGTFSSIRTSDVENHEMREWKQYTRRYAISGRPVGAMVLQHGFMRLLVSCSSLQVITIKEPRNLDILEVLITSDRTIDVNSDKATIALSEVISDIVAEQMRLLEDGSDYLQLGSAWQQRLAFAVKRCALTTFLNCTIVNKEIADVEVLISWLEDAMADPVQMADDDLASTVLKAMTIVAKISSSNATMLSRSLPRFIVHAGIQESTVRVAARCLSYVLQLLSQDAVITGLYSLGNILSAGTTVDKGFKSGSTNGHASNARNAPYYAQQATSSAISLDLGSEKDTSAIYGNVVCAIVSIATCANDEKITALAQSMLVQKLGRLGLAIDLRIIAELASLASSGGQNELKSLLKLFSRVSHDGIKQNNSALLGAVLTARKTLATSLPRESPLWQIYLVHLLETIVSSGDVHESEDTRQADVEFAAIEITQLLQPLAMLLSSSGNASETHLEETLMRLHREAWFNIAVHGIVPGSELGDKYTGELRTLALHSRPLIAEDRADQLESDVDLNTILRRGMNGPRTTEQKRHLLRLLPTHEADVRVLTYPKVIFLSAAYLVETLRADAGDCSHILTYFLSPSVNKHEMGKCMGAVADEVLAIYLRRTLSGRYQDSSAPYVGRQLALILTGCCHRIPMVQYVATRCVDRIVTQMPSALCQKSSLFALLELLNIMWSSCLEADIDEYEWKSTYRSPRGKVAVELSDDYAFRKQTLSMFHRRAKQWTTKVISVAPLDVKGLLQTYLSEYDDDGAYGHISLGRSLALELGSAIPTTDQRLEAIDMHGEININTASDFMAQYTTRQEYRYAETLPEFDQLRVQSSYGIRPNGDMKLPSQDVKDAQAILYQIEQRVHGKKAVSMGELREVLRRAAALLCRSKTDQCAIVRYLVGIPFAIFTKQSIKLGISLWLGVINENPRMEPRILTEVAENWERTVETKVGVFSNKFNHLDPFYLKAEFAPSDKAGLFKRQQAVHDLIAPHLRILQFLISHFNAVRLGSPHLPRIFQRMVRITLQGLRQSSGHPLAREAHFQVILFALSILRCSDGWGIAARWRLKDSILSAALAWFAGAPSWSYGGNRLQLKAENRLISDVANALNRVNAIGIKASTCLPSLVLKQILLLRLLQSEQARLEVWLYPLDQERQKMSASSQSWDDAESMSLLQSAWNEHSGLAIQLTVRFHSGQLLSGVRDLLFETPERAVEEPDALQIMLDYDMPKELSIQLRYLLYWQSVSPITAVTYFLPAYSNHPLVLQYAMRALESHSVDITFFYVPQIVQTLRYDVLGYVQRYIVETAKFSQLFAHQIIWNMKANAYKDEDSSIEDPVKPTLDIVMQNMIASFSTTDRAFYEREFSFFNEITDISGKLRPFIKKSKPEKKQKIEEELRRIKVEVGVYLPSNPDGVVIGIDRKSGKPLQSHAKAPYMATFRIKKHCGDMKEIDDLLQRTNESRTGPETELGLQDDSYEVWQSAIFKVGDDCRQDVLALQMIAAFRGIFNNVGLDVYVSPYRVTATAPGCGVIDVLPNSISRDMLGREAVNGLYDYFVSKYGGEESVRFQEARSNFVKSMAAYSVISYLLQFKDRHNGNIMIDDAGHILHIDFGFCFDIAPGGVRFERAPFKLTSEMVAVMGGSTTSQSYRWFEELCIKSFLASRQHTQKLCQMVILMLDSGLPCFKPETIQHFRERFVLDKSEREAADFMKDLIKKSYNSYSTRGYDQFQLLTNGIPY